MRREGVGRGTQPAGRRLRLLVLAASVLALVGLGQLALGRLPALGWLPALGSGAHPPELHAEAPDGITVGVARANWVEMDHDEAEASGPGYQMPMSMMPGMPAEGQVRLAVALTLTNASAIGRAVDPASEFVLRSTTNDDSWEPVADTFAGLSRLGATSGSNGTIYFDLPPPGNDQAKLYVDWKHSGKSQRLAVPFDGAPITHSHE